MSALQIVDEPQNNLPTKDNYTTSKHVAKVCGELVKRTAVKIQGKQYVQVEGWEAIAVAHGCFVGAGDVDRAYDKKTGNHIGWNAIASIRNKEGLVISTGEGFVGKDERNWSNRDEYACRAMAQTRAISRVCRSTFAHVVVMIDNNLQTTPAEEMPAGPQQTVSPLRANYYSRITKLIVEAKKKGKQSPVIAKAKQMIKEVKGTKAELETIGTQLYELVNGYPPSMATTKDNNGGLK